MRPKRHILIFDADPEGLGVWRHILSSKGYLPWGASNLDELKRLFSDAGALFDVAIIDHTNLFGMASRKPISAGKWLASEHPEIRKVSLIEKTGSLSYSTEICLREPGNTMAHVWDAVRTLAARKRGPKPTAKRELITA